MRTFHAKDDVQLEHDLQMKAWRNQIRLKYSLLAEREINELLDEKSKQFMRELAAGEMRELSINTSEIQ